MKLTSLPLIAFAAILLLGFPGESRAHCQIPCGIYDDPARFAAMRENVATIEKSMQQIKLMSSQRTQAHGNQIARWVANKEHHADDLAKIATYYFLAQRVKAPVDEDNKDAQSSYHHQLAILHQIVVHAMLCKQTIDTANCTKLRGLITDFEKSYTAE